MQIPDDNSISLLNLQLLKAHKADEEFWKKRSCLLWLTLGDRNTSFFHASTKGRRARNRISVLEDHLGNAVFEDDKIATVISDYFKGIFTSSGASATEVVEKAISPCISESTNTQLTALPSPQEIKEAMFAIHPDKAPGPDGFSASFFQSNWEVVGPVLQSIVSENQPAFILGRTISDNVLITHEMLHYLKVSGAVKHWINWMMQCVSSVSYSFLLNNEVVGDVTPQRGIRQGDPLSPYIFIIYGEVLSGLLFADDTMIFTRSDPQSCDALLDILTSYELASGQKINPQKSSITFSRKTPTETRDRVKLQLSIEKEGGVGKYLGLPEHFGRKKKDLFSSIIDRMRQRSINWSTQFLSTAGKAIMLQTVLSAIQDSGGTLRQGRRRFVGSPGTLLPNQKAKEA